MSSLTLCSMRTLGHRTNRSLYPARCHKLGVYRQELPFTIQQYDIPGEEESRLDEVPIESAPSQEWLPDEVVLQTVTISNMSIDSKHVQTDG